MKKATMLICGHFALGTEQRCGICAGRDAAKAARDTLAVSEPDPTWAVAAAAPVTAAAAVLGTDEPQPGVYQIPDSIYHRDPLKAYGTESLSGSSARLLLPPNTPAHYRYRIDHPSDSRTPAMIFGSAVHALTLDTACLAAFDGGSWTSKAGEQFLAEHDPDGDDAPILARDVPAAGAMARALLTHPIVKMGLSNGEPEQAVFAQHPATGVWLRGKLDYLARAAGDHLIITDIKTAESASVAEFTRAVGKLSYHIQAAHYARIIRLLRLAKKVTMIFATVEKSPPYLVNVHQIDSEDLKRAEELDEMAIGRFAHCLDTGEWPGYPERINKITLPPWVARAEDEALCEGDDE